MTPPLSNVFPDPLEVRDHGMINGRRHWMLLSDFRCLTSKGAVYIPAGFVTDLTSTPRFTWSILSPSDDYMHAALPHDLLYSKNNLAFTRLESDQIFREAMFNLGIDWVRRETIFRAVRMFGARSYQGLRK